jgi:hypothetical protein
MAFRRSHRTSAHADLSAPDQTLLDLVNGLRDLTKRVSTMERQFDVLGNPAAGTTGHDDDGIMDLRLQIARLSAELSRVAVEINARIAEVAGSAGVALSDDSVTPVPTPDLAADESFVDLTADSPARARTGTPPADEAESSRRTSGWQPAG